MATWRRLDDEITEFGEAMLAEGRKKIPWKILEKKLNKGLPPNKKRITAKQCGQRWRQDLRPDITKNKDIDEDWLMFLYGLVKEMPIGQKAFPWTLLGRVMGRGDNDLKNRAKRLSCKSRVVNTVSLFTDPMSKREVEVASDLRDRYALDDSMIAQMMRRREDEITKALSSTGGHLFLSSGAQALADTEYSTLSIGAPQEEPLQNLLTKKLKRSPTLSGRASPYNKKQAVGESSTRDQVEQPQHQNLTSATFVVDDQRTHLGGLWADQGQHQSALTAIFSEQFSQPLRTPPIIANISDLESIENGDRDIQPHTVGRDYRTNNGSGSESDLKEHITKLVISPQEYSSKREMTDFQEPHYVQVNLTLGNPEAQNWRLPHQLNNTQPVYARRVPQKRMLDDQIKMPLAQQYAQVMSVAPSASNPYLDRFYGQLQQQQALTGYQEQFLSQQQAQLANDTQAPPPPPYNNSINGISSISSSPALSATPTQSCPLSSY